MGAIVGRQVVGFGGIFDEALTAFRVERTTSVPGSAEGWVASPARKLPPSFRTGDPSYFVAASTFQRESHGADRLERVDRPGSHRMHGTRDAD